MTAPVDSLSPDEVRELLALADAATEEGWWAAESPSRKLKTSPTRFEVLAPSMTPSTPVVAAFVSEPDADFIAAARTAVPRLARDLLAARAERDRLQHESDTRKHIADSYYDRLGQAEAERDRLAARVVELETRITQEQTHARMFASAADTEKFEAHTQRTRAKVAVQDRGLAEIAARQERELRKAAEVAFDRLAQDRDRLRKALEELGPRSRHETWCHAYCQPKTVPCSCGADEWNAKVAAALKDGGGT